MDKKIKVLQIGVSSWEKNLTLNHKKKLDWIYLNPCDLEENYLECIVKNQKGKTFDVVICTDLIDNSVLEKLNSVIEVYGMLIDRKLRSQLSIVINKQKCPFYIDLGDKEWVFQEIIDNFFSGQMGSKFHVNTLLIDYNFKGKKVISGENYLELQGDFSQVQAGTHINWQYNVGMNKRSKKIWLEFNCEDTVDFSMNVLGIKEGSSEVEKNWFFSKEEICQGIEIDYVQNIGYLSISLLVLGKGSFKIGPLHYRDSRHKYGEYILGGEKISDQNNQELYYYFNPGDLRPPLNVYFSGYRSAEGFEGFYMMKSLGAPFLLITDPRLEGGAFYMGSQFLEDQLVQVIKSSLSKLGFNNKELILSGLSMGTYGALYYSSKFSPHSVIIGKPLVNIGTVAGNERIIRPGGFSTSLDILKLLTGTLTNEGIYQLNQRFWDSFNQGNYSKTQFIVSYMKNDDYDISAYPDLVKNLIDKNSKIIGKGIPGRHNDNSAAINEWFINHYKRILREDFGRKIKNEL